MVTIVVPAYNHENYAEDCIESILGQDYPSLELIVIDDGSKDKTAEKIRGLQEKAKRPFVFISKKNEGLVKTLNMGLSMAKGKYFCELASDDMLAPGSIRKKVEFLEQEPEMGAVFTDAYLIKDGKKTETRIFGANSLKRYDPSVHGIREIVDNKAKIFFASGLFRTELLKKLGGFGDSLVAYEDILLKYELVLKSKVGYIDEPLNYYRLHSSNTSLNRMLGRRDKITIFGKLSAEAETAELKKFFEDCLFREYMKYVRFGLKNNEPREELKKAAKKAFSMRPLSIKALYLRLRTSF